MIASAGVGGKVSDGNQWEIHSIGLDGTGDVTNFEAVNQLSAQTVHSFWPWGSPLNGGTVTDFFYSGFASNDVSQYPSLSLSGCSYWGTARPELLSARWPPVIFRPIGLSLPANKVAVPALRTFTASQTLAVNAIRDHFRSRLQRSTRSRISRSVSRQEPGLAVRSISVRPTKSTDAIGVMRSTGMAAFL